MWVKVQLIIYIGKFTQNPILHFLTSDNLNR